MRRSIVKRSIAYVLVLLVAGVVVISIPELSKPEYSSDKRFNVGRANVSITVRPDTTLEVVEHLRFRFSDHDFSGAYRDIPVQRGVELTNIAVSDSTEGDYEDGANAELGSYDDPGTFGVTSIANNATRIVWHYDADGGERSFDVRYRLTGAAEAYDDAVLIPAAIWGDQWNFTLEQLRGSVRFPEAAGGAAPIQAWRRPGGLLEQPSLTKNGATLAVDRARPKQQVTLSVAYPRSAFASVDSAQDHQGETLADLRQREDKASDGFSLGAQVADKVVPISLLLMLLSMAAALWLMLRSRERPTGVPCHLPEPPSEASPAVAYALANEGGYDDRLVLATLLDLIDRDYYVARSTGEADDELDLEISMPAERKPDTGLLPHEIGVRQFFDLLVGTEPGRLGELSDRIPKHDEKWRERWTLMKASLEAAESGELEWDRDHRAARWQLAAVIALALGIVAVLYFSRMQDLGLPVWAAIAAVGFIFVVPARGYRRLSPESRERQAQWEAFSRWTKDFPRLDDDPPATLLLWRRILVYAVAFGTAERVAKSGRIPASVMAEASQSGGWSSGMVHGASYGFLAGSAGSFGSGFSSQVAAESSSSGGGGGGGGFSGGGGGGAW